MYRAPPLRGCPLLAGKKVLLIDCGQAAREIRASVLRSYGVEVDEAVEIPDARFLWRPNVYGLVMLNVRRYAPEEVLKFYEELKGRSPDEHFVFLVGPPRYVSRTWPDDFTDDASRGQWGETVKRFVAAA